MSEIIFKSVSQIPWWGRVVNILATEYIRHTSYYNMHNHKSQQGTHMYQKVTQQKSRETYVAIYMKHRHVSVLTCQDWLTWQHGMPCIHSSP